MLKVILSSHGPMGSAMLESAKMIYGITDNVVSVCLNIEDEVISFKNKLENEIQDSENVLLLTDIIGGTPFKLGMVLKDRYPNLKVVSGMNLAMLIETLILQETLSFDELIKKIVDTGKESIKESFIELEVDDIELL